MMSAFVVAIVLLALVESRVAVNTNVRYHPAPATVYVTVRIDPRDEDRWLDVAAEGTTHRQATGRQLEGAGSARIRQIRFNELPAGCYEFVAEIRQRDEDGPVVARAVSAPLSVYGVEIEGDPCA